MKSRERVTLKVDIPKNAEPGGSVHLVNSRNAPSASVRAWAERLLAVDGAGQSAWDTHGHQVVRVCEKLRTSLTQFIGADGFTALLRRALALARAEIPSLQTAQVAADGRLEGIEEIPPDAVLIITAHLLGLLVTFIGESVTLRLIRKALPDAADRKIAEEPKDLNEQQAN